MVIHQIGCRRREGKGSSSPVTQDGSEGGGGTGKNEGRGNDDKKKEAPTPPAGPNKKFNPKRAGRPDRELKMFLRY